MASRKSAREKGAPERFTECCDTDAIIVKIDIFTPEPSSVC